MELGSRIYADDSEGNWGGYWENLLDFDHFGFVVEDIAATNFEAQRGSGNSLWEFQSDASSVGRGNELFEDGRAGFVFAGNFDAELRRRFRIEFPLDVHRVPFCRFYAGRKNFCRSVSGLGFASFNRMARGVCRGGLSVCSATGHEVEFARLVLGDSAIPISLKVEGAFSFD